MGQKGGLKTRLRIFCRGEVAPTPVVQFRANISNDADVRCRSEVSVIVRFG